MLAVSPATLCCGSKTPFAAVWSLMAQRGLACSARRGRTHLGSAIRSADPENIYVMALRSLQRRERSGGCR